MLSFPILGIWDVQELPGFLAKAVSLGRRPPKPVWAMLTLALLTVGPVPLLDSWEAAGVRRGGPNRLGVVCCMRELVCATQTCSPSVRP